MLRDLIGERREHDVLVAGIHEVLVDFVRHHEHAVAQADFGHALEFSARPHASDRIVRTAQHKELHAVLDDLALEILEVDGVFLSVETQFVHDEFAAVVADALAEAVVHGLLDQDRVSGLREAADQRADREHDARRAHRRVRIDRPAVTRPEPVRERVEIRLVGVGIPEDAVRGFRGERVPHALRRLEIHVRHPHRQQAVRLAALFGEVVFEAVGVLARDDLVEIVLHAGSSSVFFSSADRRSSMRSSAFSMPTEIRRKRSLMPRLRRSSSGTSACVWSMG